MLSRLASKAKLPFSTIVFACSDALCYPKHGVREFIQQNGISPLEEVMIHSIRVPGGVHNALLQEKQGFDRATLDETQMLNIGAMIQLKNAKIIVIDGHTPCGACQILNIDTEQQKILLLDYADQVYKRFSVPVVALIEDHRNEEHWFEVIGSFGVVYEAMAAE